MEGSGELGLRSAQAVSREFQFTYREIRIGALPVFVRKAGAPSSLLGRSRHREGARGPNSCSVTHEEMAQRIGASRETVTRLLSELRKKDLIKLEGTTLVIKNRPAREALAV